jgi:hypothetical protein
MVGDCSSSPGFRDPAAVTWQQRTGAAPDVPDPVSQYPGQHRCCRI